MSESVSQTYVVDDDLSVREAVGSLIRSVGLNVKTFASTQEMLASLQKELPSCSVLDIQLPDVNGFELQRELATKDIQIPIMIIRSITKSIYYPTSEKQSHLIRESRRIRYIHAALLVRPKC
jgi:FixJ family two-component response regulator